ncbi:MAG: hypothetical protein NUV68_05180 [Caldiserica bacterium]|jgi:hypothetical protein|nr:hypothetical protein [Caldisericota bacterium]MDH7562721.1 hypothetical protein [Caldisericota bacterium]
MFDWEQYKDFFSQFFAEFSRFMEEFQSKAHIYGDLWQFLLARAAKELGILPQDEDRLLTPEETRQLYERASAFMSSLPREEFPGLEEKEEDGVEKDLKPGKMPRPSWFNFEPPDLKKEEKS